MRRTALVVASLVASAALQPVAAHALAPVERAVRISLSAPATVAPHSTITLTGRTQARRGTRVKIYQRPANRSSWVLEGSTRVKKRGKFRYSEGITDFSRYYRACVRRSCSAARLVTVAKPTPPPPPTPQATSLTLTTGPAAQIEAGQSVTVSGTASANLVGTTVYLQAFDAGSSTWGSVGGAVVDGNASWTVTGPIGTAGKAIGLRVVSPDSPYLLGSSVAAGVVAVFGWYYFQDDDAQPYAVDAGDSYYGATTLNGVPYGHGLIFYDDTAMSDSWNLNRSCKTFAATVGLSDYADPTSRYATQVYADAVQKSALSGLALGQSTPVSIDVTNALRLRIDVQRTSGDYAYLQFADARALCAF